MVHHKMGLGNNRWTMRAKFAANVASERSPVLRVTPLFIKNIAMKAVFDTVGECKSCLCLSNLGRVELPEGMVPYVRRMDFIIGVQAKAPHDCGVVTWGDTAYIICIRSIREPELEYHFYRVLHRLGLPVKVESNMRWHNGRKEPFLCIASNVAWSWRTAKSAVRSAGRRCFTRICRAI